MLINVYEWWCVNDAGDGSKVSYHYTVLKLIKLFFFFLINTLVHTHIHHALVLGVGIYDIQYSSNRPYRADQK